MWSRSSVGSVSRNLRHEDVETSDIVGRSSPGKVGGFRLAGYIRVTAAVDGDGVSVVLGRAAQVRRIADRGINHQFAAAIVVAQLKADLVVGLQNKTRIDRLAGSVFLLVSDGLVQQDVSRGRSEHQIAGIIGGDMLRAGNAEADRRSDSRPERR